MAKENKTKTNEPEQPPVEGAEVKQAVITSADTRGDSPKKLRAPGFRGSYKGVQFDDDGVSQTPVSSAIRAELQAQYPALVIEEIE
ncbi:MAG: hypothetical protein HY231_23780 [Acidobacteria bacterium]|nr:hypothetical protein [Acidobacteriota bacterium]